MVTPIILRDHCNRFDAVERAAEQVLAALDDLGQHQAAAYVAMALDAMRRARLDGRPTD